MLRVIPEPLLSERTTIRLGGPAIAEIRVENEEDCLSLPEQLQKWGGRPFVLGAGSNLLAADGPLPLVLLRAQCTEGPECVAEDNTWGRIRVGAGVRIPRLLSRCAAMGLGGLEGLCGIPGTVGGAVAMNAGSFGSTIGSYLDEICIYTPARGIVHIPASQLDLRYRSMQIKNFSGWFLLVSATFTLTRSERNGINEKMSRNFFKKKSTQPLKAWSAGCAFKNPSPEQAAWMLLDKAGFRGKEYGGMAFSAMHANFLVNEGRGTAGAAMELIAQAQEAVKREFGVMLEPEIRIVT